MTWQRADARRRSGGRRRRLGRLAAVVAVAAMLGSLLSVAVSTTTPEKAAAATGSQFTAGNLIDDATFFNGTSMTAGQIQTFLNGKVSSCRSGYTCLKSYRQTTKTIAADSHCSRYTGASNETAASIIAKVGKACGINPEVLLVTLQKEQGLVTDTWPTTGQYRIAMGFACPDSSVCDSKYYGFFNQVYSAARQFQVYVTNPGYFNFAAGRTSKILYNPKTSCGSSNVTIQNAATAALYNYTPYQPNAAALKQSNLYGTGDGCSSYGNRNFWVYFTDWFGSTQAEAGKTMIRAAGTSAVYILIGTTLHHIPNQPTQQLFMPLGPTRVVDPAFLSVYSIGADIGPVVRDPTSHVVGLVQGGQLHRFDSCARLAQWGTPCGSGDYLNLTPAQIKLFPLGAPVDDFYSVAGGSSYNWIHDGVGYPLENAAAATALNGRTAPFVGTMPAAGVAALPKGRTLLQPGALVHGASSSTPYLVTGLGSVAKVPSYAYSAEMGVSGTAQAVSDAVLKPYLATTSTLSLVVTCGSTAYLANSGRLTRIAAGNTTGLASTPMDSYGCAAMNRSGTITGNVYLNKAGTNSLALLTGGETRPIGSPSTAVTLNSGTAASIVTLSAAGYARIPAGSTVVAPPSLIKRSDRPEVYLVDGFAQKIHLPNWGVGDALGLDWLRTLSPSTVDGYPTAKADLSMVVTCGGTQYFGAAGVLRRVDSAGGLPVTALQDSTCRKLNRSSAAASKAIWIKVSSSPKVYEVIGGTRHWIPDEKTLASRNGGRMPTVWTIGSRQLQTIPAGAALPSVDTPPAGTLIRYSADKAVYLVVDGTHKLHLPNWPTAHALGLGGEHLVSTYVVQALGTLSGDLHRVVTCAGVHYFGAGGTLYAIDPKDDNGLAVTSLDATTCKALSLSKDAPARAIWIKTASAPEVYEIIAGTRRHVPNEPTLIARNGGTMPRVWVVAGDELSSIPLGSQLPSS